MWILPSTRHGRIYAPVIAGYRLINYSTFTCPNRTDIGSHYVSQFKLCLPCCVRYEFHETYLASVRQGKVPFGECVFHYLASHCT